MRNPADSALAHLRKLLARDPMLRDLVAESLPHLTGGGGVVPDVDVLETDDHHLVLVELPGVPRDSVRVRLEGSHLVVTGTKPAHRPEGATVRTAERTAGPFRRTFLLPPDVDGAAVTADLTDGVLRVEVPRRPGAARDVEISGG